MKISIVIPAYNEASVLAETLRHAAAQAYSDYEVIVVDNASSDATGEVARSVPGVRVIREEQKGLLHARERGLREARGAIIANMDADCLPDPQWLARGARHFADPSIVAVTGPYDYYDATAFFRTVSLLLQKTAYPLTHWISHRLLGKSAILIGGNNMIRRSSLEKIGGYSTSILFYGEDTDTAKRIASTGQIVYDNSFTIKTSARRFKSMGALRVSWLYLSNFVWVSVFGKPYTN